MTGSGNDVVLGRHLDSLSSVVNNKILSASSSNILDTVPSTVDGGLWYELVNGEARLKLRQGTSVYLFQPASSQKVFDDNVTLVSHLPFDSSATEDVCGNTWTATGNASLDSSVKKFGASSVHLPSQAYLSATDILNLNAEKWTFDAWLYLTSGESYRWVLGLGTISSGQAGIYCSPAAVYIADDSGSNWATNVPTATLGWDAVNTWMHVAIVKDGSSLMFFKDGVKKFTYTLQTDIYDGGGFYLGCTNGAPAYNDSYFDNVRFFEGALWTDDFTPPTASDYE